MVCVQYTAVAQPISTPAPVLSVTVTKLGETTVDETVLVKATCGSGTSTPGVSIRLDGQLVGYDQRQPNGTNAGFPITVLKDGLSHQICVE